MEKLAYWQKINELDQKLLLIFKRMKMIELATTAKEAEVRKDFPADYQKYIQAKRDMHMFQDEAYLEDLQDEVKRLGEILKMHQDTLATYDLFYHHYATIFGPNNLEDVYAKNPEQEAKIKLINECMTLIFPHITPELEPLMRTQFESKSLNELADIMRCFKMDDDWQPKV